jgi:hypothetical protein
MACHPFIKHAVNVREWYSYSYIFAFSYITSAARLDGRRKKNDRTSEKKRKEEKKNLHFDSHPRHNNKNNKKKIRDVLLWAAPSSSGRSSRLFCYSTSVRIHLAALLSLSLSTAIHTETAHTHSTHMETDDDGVKGVEPPLFQPSQRRPNSSESKVSSPGSINTIRAHPTRCSR